MYGILIVFHVIIAVCLIGLVLIQQGKGAQAGASFGSGASQTVFGSQGSTGFLSRATAILGTLFFILNLALAYVVNHSSEVGPTIGPVTVPISESSEQESTESPAQTPEQTSDIPDVE